jgi:serine/threonine protein kinase
MSFDPDDYRVELGARMLASLQRELSGWVVDTRQFVQDRVLGKGASGQVYLAHDASGRQVAVK